MFTAIVYYEAQDYEKCAIALTEVDVSSLDIPQAKSLYTVMSTKVYPDVVQKYYQDGRTKCNNGQYDEALTVLLLAYKMDPTNVDVLYFIGRSYQKDGDNNNALKYYNILIEKAPGSNRATTAKTRISEIEKAQAQAQPQ